MAVPPHYVRIARVRVKPGCETEFDALFETVVVSARRGLPGMIRLYQMRKTDAEGATEYVIASVWRTLAELERYKACTSASLIPKEMAHAIESGSVDEYELLAVDDYDVL